MVYGVPYGGGGWASLSGAAMRMGVPSEAADPV